MLINRSAHTCTTKADCNFYLFNFLPCFTSWPHFSTSNWKVLAQSVTEKKSHSNICFQPFTEIFWSNNPMFLNCWNTVLPNLSLNEIHLKEIVHPKRKIQSFTHSILWHFIHVVMVKYKYVYHNKTTRYEYLNELVEIQRNVFSGDVPSVSVRNSDCYLQFSVFFCLWRFVDVVQHSQFCLLICLLIICLIICNNFFF